MMELIMYLMIQTHSDIYFVVIILSRYNYNFNSKYIIAVKWVIHYLKKILTYDIIYGMANVLKGYTDAD